MLNKFLSLLPVMTIFCVFLGFVPTVSANKIYVVGVQNFSQYYPYSSYQDQVYKGFNRELLDAFARKHNYQFKYQALPIKRLYRRFVDEKLDLKYPDSPKWSPDVKAGKEVIYSEPVVHYIDGVMVLNDRVNTGVGNLKRLGMIAGFTPWPYLDAIDNKQIEIDESYKYDYLLMKIISGRVDGGYSNIAVSQFYLNQMGMAEDTLVFDDSLPHSSGTRHLSSIKHPELIDQFNAFLIEEAEWVNKLKKRYQLQ